MQLTSERDPMEPIRNRMEPLNLAPNLEGIRTLFPHFQFLQQKQDEPLHEWVTRMATLSGNCPKWDFLHLNKEWRCTFYMKAVMIASCSAKKKKNAWLKTSKMALENLGVICCVQELPTERGGGARNRLPVDERQVTDESPAIQGREDLTASFIEENILEIQKKILSNQEVISDSIKRIVGSASFNVKFRDNIHSDPRISYFNRDVVRAEISIIKRQNNILGYVDNFSASQNPKHCSDFQIFEEQCHIMSYQSGFLGNLNKLNLEKFSLSEEDLYLIQACEVLNKRKPLLVNERMIGEKWNLILENQTSMLDNLLGIMSTLSGIAPDIENGFEMSKRDSHVPFLENVTVTYKFKICYHENEISAMLNEVMHTHRRIVESQRQIVLKEDQILKAFHLCVFSKVVIREMSNKSPFIDNELYVLQLRTWAGINHFLSKLNQVYLDRIDVLCGGNDVVKYQSEVLSNQKSILANLSRFPGIQAAILENQRLILCIQDEVLDHYIPTTKGNEPIGEDNIGFKLLKSLGWSGGGLGSSQQGISEPVRAEGCVGRTGLGYKAVELKNPRKRSAPDMSKLCENLRTKCMRLGKHPQVPLVGGVPIPIAFCPATKIEKVDSQECITLD